MSKQVYLHLGLPKCGSTSIQSILSRNKAIEYFGFEPDKEGLCFYTDTKIAEFFDKIARFSCTDSEYYRKYIQHCISISIKENVVFSSENLSLRFLPWDLPTHIKFEYISKIFPSNTIFLMAYRNPLELLKSLYKDWLLLGYEKNYNEFIEEIYTYKDISFLNDICLGLFLVNYKKWFSPDKLKIFFVDKQNIANAYDGLLTTKETNIVMNKSLSDLEAQIVYDNNKNNRDFHSMFDRIEMHRAFFNIDNDFKYMTSRKRRSRRYVAKSLSKYSASNEDFFVISNDNFLNYLRDDLINAKKILKKNLESVSYICNYLHTLG